MSTLNRINDIKLEDNYFKSYNLGYKTLDEMLGKIKEKNIITIAARPEMGKTNFINNIILNLLSEYNLPTLYVNLEEDKENSLIRLSSIYTKKPFYNIREDKKLINKTVDKFQKENYNLFISDDSLTILDLENLLEENKSINIKFLFINYIQNVKNEKVLKSSYDTCKDIANRIQKLSNKYNLVIFLSSQLPRSIENRKNKRPLLSDLKYEGLEEISDIVIMLYHDYCYDTKVKSEIIVSKNRNGSLGTTYLEYDRELLTFSENN